MDDAGIGPLPHFLAQDGERIFLRIAGVDDERKAGRAGRSDMGAEAALLPGAVAMIVIIVEAGFADADHARVGSAFDQLGRVDMGMLVGLVGMDSHCGVDIGLLFGCREHRIPFAFARRYVEHQADASGARTFKHILLIFDQTLVIQVTMAVDQHGSGVRFGEFEAREEWLGRGEGEAADAELGVCAAADHFVGPARLRNAHLL